MNQWKEYKLGEILEIKYGKDHKHLPNGKIPVYGSGGIMRYADRFIYDKESILIPRKGSLTNIFYKNEPFWTVDTMFWTKIDTEIVLPKCLFYKLKLIDFEALNVGSAVPSLTVEVLKDVDILLPPLPEQRAIASILSSLDDKIDLLHRQNATLEALAETLFRQWFVEEAEEGWEKGRLGDLINVKYGKDHKNLQDGTIPVYGSGGVMRYANKALYTQESVLIPRKGTLSNVLYINEPFWTVDTMFYTEMKQPNLAKFIFHFVKEKDLASMNVGSAVPSMTTEILNNLPLNIPPREKLAQFEQSVEPMYRKVNTNHTQIRILTQLRDTLLPKLMSGEVRVSEQKVNEKY